MFMFLHVCLESCKLFRLLIVKLQQLLFFARNVTRCVELEGEGCKLSRFQMDKGRHVYNFGVIFLVLSMRGDIGVHIYWFHSAMGGDDRACADTVG